MRRWELIRDRSHVNSLGSIVFYFSPFQIDSPAQSICANPNEIAIFSLLITFLSFQFSYFFSSNLTKNKKKCSFGKKNLFSDLEVTFSIQPEHKFQLKTFKRNNFLSLLNYKSTLFTISPFFCPISSSKQIALYLFMVVLRGMNDKFAHYFPCQTNICKPILSEKNRPL